MFAIETCVIKGIGAIGIRLPATRLRLRLPGVRR